MKERWTVIIPLLVAVVLFINVVVGVQGTRQINKYLGDFHWSFVDTQSANATAIDSLATHVRWIESVLIARYDSLAVVLVDDSTGFDRIIKVVEYTYPRTAPAPIHTPSAADMLREARAILGDTTSSKESR